MKTIELNWQEVAQGWAWNMHHKKGETLSEDEVKIVDALKEIPLPKLMHLCTTLTRLVREQLKDDMEKVAEQKHLRERIEVIEDCIPTGVPEGDEALENCLSALYKKSDELGKELSTNRKDLAEQGYPGSVYNLFISF